MAKISIIILSLICASCTQAPITDKELPPVYISSLHENGDGKIEIIWVSRTQSNELIRFRVDELSGRYDFEYSKTFRNARYYRDEFDLKPGTEYAYVVAEITGLRSEPEKITYHRNLNNTGG